MKLSLEIRIKRRRNAVEKDLHTAKYRMRVVSSKKLYKRAAEKQKYLEEYA